MQSSEFAGVDHGVFHTLTSDLDLCCSCFSPAGFAPVGQSWQLLISRYPTPCLSSQPICLSLLLFFSVSCLEPKTGPWVSVYALNACFIFWIFSPTVSLMKAAISLPFWILIAAASIVDVNLALDAENFILLSCGFVTIIQRYLLHFLSHLESLSNDGIYFRSHL